eukprot:CAMPEP_0202747942 /NCGR_PEP_ID=MMETSP1388-20130828/9365_1 /ASSEMBLY_ACC=CAM_ASM_000864 /TAXON_ID=37098 /ORGANISM="Isochrysis sp, Strain CCMP1244" /LENGTH=101 /DNA_ID=CAMNT_0049415321 /DNA_START=239 /DNA_END=541 /DNA_ORIENTATION=-
MHMHTQPSSAHADGKGSPEHTLSSTPQARVKKEEVAPCAVGCNAKSRVRECCAACIVAAAANIHNSPVFAAIALALPPVLSSSEWGVHANADVTRSLLRPS